MPRFIKDEEMRERFSDETYVKELEDVFMQRFSENLQVSKGLQFVF